MANACWPAGQCCSTKLLLCIALIFILVLVPSMLCCPSPTHQLTVRQLLPWARDNLLQDRPELFMKGDSV
jgi:hypothetical protein